jgi:DNA polymerase (family 10)
LDYLFTHHQYPPKIRTLFKSIDPAVFVLNEVNTIGPKTAAKLVKEIKFPVDKKKIIAKLIDYAKKNNKTTLLKNAKEYIGNVDRLPYKTANQLASEIIDYLKQKFSTYEILSLGSLRRKTPTIGDIDIAICAPASKDVIDYFVSYPKSYGTFDQGPKKASIKLKGNIRVDLMVEPKKNWGNLVQHFTGSKNHNIELRKYALKKGLSISEYGIKDKKTGKLHQFDKEKDLYIFLGFPYLKPEER